MMALNNVNIQRALQQASNLLRAGRFHCQSKLNHCPADVRTVCVFRRLTPPSRSHIPDTPLLERHAMVEENYVYSLEENTMSKPQGDMTVILKYDIEGLGMKGDVITVTKRMARSILLPAGVAMYASPENLAANEEERLRASKRERKSIWAQKTVRALKEMHLPIAMNPLTPWTLTKAHIRIAFRQVGVQIDEDCIDLPEEPVSAFGPVTFHVTVNKSDRVEVSGTIYNFTVDHRYKPTREVWGHRKVTVTDAVIEVMKENGLVENAELATIH